MVAIPPIIGIPYSYPHSNPVNGYHSLIFSPDFIVKTLPISNCWHFLILFIFFTKKLRVFIYKYNVIFYTNIYVTN
jgi:hypothetical protein